MGALIGPDPSRADGSQGEIEGLMLFSFVRNVYVGRYQNEYLFKVLF
jgi:hypothetical protein